MSNWQIDEEERNVTAKLLIEQADGSAIAVVLEGVEATITGHRPVGVRQMVYTFEVSGHTNGYVHFAPGEERTMPGQAALEQKEQDA
ncbi:hypothetical protein [Agromyces sp. SYSU T00194]|uniref:hypothetical protein n=1 Tax=Agromyces chitinivorans TaxID=3158560 RepID=UPI00339779FA